MTAQLILFGTEGCHLCEQAQAAVDDATGQWTAPVTFETLDVCIEGRDHWYQLYAHKIPVLLHAESGLELLWPFSKIEVAEFLGAIDLIGLSTQR